MPIDIGKDEQFKPDFLKISPNNRIPAIVDRDNGMSLMESGAILIYLADKTGKLLPKSGEARYRVHRMADVADGRPRPDARPGASLREIQQGQGALRRGALPARRRTGSMACSTAGSPSANSSPTTIRSPTSRSGRGSRASSGRRSTEPVSEREALVPGDRQAARRCRRATRCRRTSARSRCREQGLTHKRGLEFRLAHKRRLFRFGAGCRRSSGRGERGRKTY